MTNGAYLFGGKPRVKIPKDFSDINTFRTFLGITAAEARKIWWYRHRMYTNFDISKKKGKTRHISAPDKRLKGLQKRISNVLYSLYRPRKSVHGFSVGRSVKTNAESHKRSTHIINVDIEDFFPSITEKRVVGLLKSLGIPSDVSELIARICCLNGHLPQGSPSSPILSNMICLKLDIELLDFAKRTRSIYTRYADDITFSLFQPPTNFFTLMPTPGQFDPSILSDELRSIFSNNGFELNSEKCHYSGKRSRQIVTGVKVNDGLNVDRRYIRDIRATLHNIKSQGAEVAQAVLLEKYGRKAKISSNVCGRINWVGHIKGRSDPVYRRLAEDFNKIFPESSIAVQANAVEMMLRSVWVVSDGLTQKNKDNEESIQGTAFFLEGVGLFTAQHCVPNPAAEYEVFHPTKTSNKFKVRVKKSCKARDLALLDHNIPESEYFTIKMSNVPPAIQDEVIAAGYPIYGPGDQINLRSGTVSALTVKHGVKLIEVTQKLTQGMSGGPVITPDHKVVGVIHKGGPFEGRDFAVRLDALKEFIDEA